MTGSHDSTPAKIPQGATRFPVSQIQQRIWSEKERMRQAHNAAFRWQLNGPIKPATVQAALQVLAERYEALRTSFAEIDGKLEQIVAPRATVELSLFDLGLLSDQERRERAEAIGREEAQQQFDLASAPLMRASLIQLGKDRAVLHLTFHSMIADGWSVGVLIREFGTVAAAMEAGASHGLAEPDLQYGDYALWQRAVLDENALQAERSYWTRQTADIPRFDVQPDTNRSPDGVRSSEIRSVLLPGPLNAAIDQFCRKQGHTRFAIAAAGLAIALHRVTGRFEVILGTQVADRDDAMAEGIVGPLMNTLPLRLPVDLGETPLRQLQRTSETIREALAHQRLPFEQIPGVAQASSKGAPLYSVNLVVQNAYINSGQNEDSRYGAIEIVSLPSHSCGALWDLSFFMVGRAEGWRISCEANPNLFERATVDHFLGMWQAAIEAVVHEHDTVMSAVERIVAIPPRKHLPAQPVRTPVRPQQLRKRRNLEDRIVRLQPYGHLTPVITLNNHSVYHHVARHLSDDRPFIDIQFFDPEGDRDLPRRAFEDFAADAVRLIRLAQPRGPYILSGLCVYGVIAFEAARQLQREGEEVRLVAIFDSWAPGYRETMPFYDRILRRLQLRFSEDLNRIRQHRRGELPFVDAYYVNRILRLLKLMPREAMGKPKASEWFDEALRVSCIGYRPKPYDGDVLVFRSEEPLTGRLFDRALGWGKLVKRLVPVHDVPGAHVEMFRPAGARVIGEAMNSFLSSNTPDR
jgi:thioesterase domain-containing protein